MEQIIVLMTIGYALLCILNGILSLYKSVLWRGGVIGFWVIVGLSVVVTPLLVFIVLLVIPNRRRARNDAIAHKAPSKSEALSSHHDVISA